jgi:hypothetical protein
MASPKSADMRDKPVFARVYAQCHQTLRGLFDALHDEAIAHCPLAKPGFTDKPDFRLSLPPTPARLWQTYCELVLQPTRTDVQCNLRIDGLRLEDLQRLTPALPLQRANRRPTETLITFPITAVTQIADAVQLIAHVYAFFSRDLPPDAGNAPSPAADDVERLKSRLRVGGKIRHVAFGVGTIAAIEGRGQLLRLTLDFGDNGQKKLSFNRAVMELLDE